MGVPQAIYGYMMCLLSRLGRQELQVSVGDLKALHLGQ